MNIKQHIEANHYPRDEKGRALVPTNGGFTAVICATDKPGPRPILGWVPTPARATSIEVAWHDDGSLQGMGTCNLLPPAPRKVEVKAWGVLAEIPGTDEYRVVHVAQTQHAAQQWGCSGQPCIALTGSYEEPW